MVSIRALAAVSAFIFGVVSARKCQNLTVPVTISSRNGVFNVTPPANNIEVTDFILNLSRQGHNYTQEVLAGYATVSGTYNLAATYCTPDKGHSKTLQILTHGIGFDRSYWDVPFNNYNYSYIAVAVDQYGFSTFSYDRLGIGMSREAQDDPVNVVQAQLEEAALLALTKMLRTGSISCASDRFQKYVHVGHSFGSILTYGLVRDNPTVSDGIVLTGFSQNGSFVPLFEQGGNFVNANTLPPLAKYPNGYFGAGDASGVQNNFFAPGDFDPAILAFATATGQPVTVGELLTVSEPATGVNKFAGPVLIITGQRDVPFCGGDCLITGDPALSSIPASSAQFLPNAAPFEVFIVPGAGHGLNLQYTHPLTYNTIEQFLYGVGLGGRYGWRT